MSTPSAVSGGGRYRAAMSEQNATPGKGEGEGERPRRPVDESIVESVTEGGPTIGEQLESELDDSADSYVSPARTGESPSQ